MTTERIRLQTQGVRPRGPSERQSYPAGSADHKGGEELTVDAYLAALEDLLDPPPLKRKAPCASWSLCGKDHYSRQKGEP